MSSTTIDFDALEELVFTVTGVKAASIDFISRDEIGRNYEVVLQNDNVVLCRLLGAQIPSYVIDSEVATMRFVRDHTSIPVPRVLAYDTDQSHLLGPYLLMEKAFEGVSLDIALPNLPQEIQDLLIAQIARWSVELFRLRLDAIGSIFANKEDGYKVGPIVHPRFFTEGRAGLDLDRGPFKTATAYLLACTQREIDSSRTLIAQDGSFEYQRDLEECRMQVEQTMSLLSNLIQGCEGLDDEDPEFAPFSLDMHDFSLRNYVISKGDRPRIISVTGWTCVPTKPLWQCGRLPRWLVSSSISLSGNENDNHTKVRLSAIFRHVVSSLEGSDSTYVKALNDSNMNSTRCTVQDLCNYDAFKDGFLLRPFLESVAATMPGSEDVVGLSAILDPSTVTGRVARITLVTSGSAGDALSLAFADMNMK